MLEVRELCAGYYGKEILHHISFSVRAGEIDVLTGPNGCGKSTLLKALIRIVPPTAGQILAEGKDTGNCSPSELARRIAYLPQGKSVPDITVGRLVLHGRFPYLSYPRKYAKADYQAAEDAMERLGILNLAELPLRQLSGGMRQKVYIAMALAQDTPVILLDEPATYLDISCQLQLMKLTRDLAAAGKAVLMVLHDLPEAMRRADRLMVMNGGQLVDMGTPEEIYVRKSLDRVFRIRLNRFQTPEGWRYYCEGS